MKRFGLAAVMALALSAMAGATSASAGKFVIEQSIYPVNVGSGPAEVTLSGAGGMVFGCESNSFETQLSGPSAALAVSPTFSNCKWASPFNHEMTLSMNGCSFELRPGEEVEAGRFDGSVDIGPTGCGPITLNDEFCERSYPAQKGLGAEYYVEGGVVTASLGGGTGLRGTTKGSPSGCAGSSTLNLSVDWSLSTGAPEVASLGIVSKNGVFLEGNEVQAELYPALLAGEQDPADGHAITFPGGRRLKCQAVAFNGQLASASTALTVTPHYSGCLVEVGESKLPTTVDVIGCGYEFNVAGSLDVACGGEGDLIRVTVYTNEEKQAEEIPLCIYEIASQSGVSGVGLSNVGEGDERGVSLDLSVTGLAYTKAQGTIGNCGGKAASASYDGTTSVTGSV